MYECLIKQLSCHRRTNKFGDKYSHVITIQAASAMEVMNVRISRLTKELEAKDKLIAELKVAFEAIALAWNELDDAIRFDEDVDNLASAIRDFPH